MSRDDSGELQTTASLPGGRAMKWLKGVNRLFFCVVVLPTIVSIVYYGFLASDVYISESRFIIRSPDKPAPSAASLTSILKGTGMSRSQDDAYAVADYILSRDALKQIDETLSFRKQVSRPEIDSISRFSGLGWDDSFEALHRYYQKQIGIHQESASPTTTLVVRAFSADDAKRINELLLTLSERLVNEMSERARGDMIRFAASEVAQAEQKAKDASVALSRYRDMQGVIDPEQQAVVQLATIGRLQETLISLRTQLIQLQTFTKDNPQIPALKKQIESIQQEIASETAKVAGGNRSLSGKAVEFKLLALDREFADRQLATALASLEQARASAQRQQLYLERVVQPNQPDYPVEPRRARNIFITFVLGCITWGILSLLLAGVREHSS